MRPNLPRFARVVLAVGLAAGGSLIGASPSEARSHGTRVAQAGPDTEELGGIDVVQVDGLLDPANAALIEDILAEAEDRDAHLVVLQLDATGAVDVDVDEVVGAVADAGVPVGVWVGPTGSDARGASGLVALNAHVVAVANGSGIGPISPENFDDPDEPTRDETLERVRDAQRRNGREVGRADEVVDARLSAGDAERLGIVDGVEPTVGDFIVSLDGTRVSVGGREVELDTADVVGVGENRRRQPNQQVRFHKLDLAQQVAHTFVTPWIAYFLFVVGLALIVFEFFTAGIGIAGFVGAVALIGACFGFSHLPVQGWALALLVLGAIGLSIDLQAGGLGVWTFIGGASLVAGSVWLYGGSSRLDPAWWMIVLVVGGFALFMLSGMTAMVRSRFSTPTVGREELVGELGVAEVDVAPDGVVRVRDALWRARTNRATPISAGAEIRVVSVEGIVLEVEPREGGARDYRERAHHR